MTNNTIRVEITRQFDDSDQYQLAVAGATDQWLQVGRINGIEKDAQGQDYLAIQLIEPVDWHGHEDQLAACQYFHLQPQSIYVKRMPDCDRNELFRLEGDGSFHPVMPSQLQEILNSSERSGAAVTAAEPQAVPAQPPTDPNQLMIADMLKHTMNLVPALCGDKGLELTYIENLGRHAVMVNGNRDECVESLQAILECYNRIVRMREEGSNNTEDEIEV